MAEVFRARLEAPAGGEKILVVKRILPSLSADPEFIRLFVNEAKIALPLTHGNITSVFEFGEVDGQYYLAMEFIHGHDLGAVLARARDEGRLFPISAALFVGAEVAKGLAYAHGLTTPDGQHMAVVHQDVSPPNILLSYDGAVKLNDFGIARMRAATTADSVSREVVRGKAHYLAPEAHEGGAIDGRVDSFALACVVCEMLSGKSPFQGHDERELLDAKRSGRFTLPSALRENLSDLDETLSRALEPDPKGRTSARDLQVHLTQHLFRRAPDFGPHEVAAFLRDLFGFELYRETVEGAGQEGVRDRLLYQLSKAGLEPSGRELQTSELLSMRTLELAGDADAKDEPRAGRKLLLTAAIAALVVAVGAGVGIYTYAQEPAPVDRDPKATQEGFGFLSLNAWPSAAVIVDGERLPERTPVIRYKVKAGPHRVVFEKPEFGLTKEVLVEVPLGGEKTVVVKLDR
ncbi:MAG: serine/threonine protein kinase [Deltaproteobacteria bacterium]|nr:serine/threonine protein kinase [Deltaproteobacteria bacterium]